MTVRNRRDACDELYKAFTAFTAGEDDAEAFMGRIEGILRDLSRAEGREGVLSYVEMSDMSDMAKDAYKARYHLGNISETLSAMMFRLTDGDADVIDLRRDASHQTL